MAQTNLPSISGFSQGLFHSTSNPVSRITTVFSGLITTLTFFGGIAFLLWFIIGALTWINSVGNPQQVDKAKNQMGTAVIGLFVIIISYGLISLLGKITGLDILNLEPLLNRLKP